MVSSTLTGRVSPEQLVHGAGLEELDRHTEAVHRREHVHVVDRLENPCGSLKSSFVTITS